MLKKLLLTTNRTKPIKLPYGSGRGCLHPDVHYFALGKDGYKYWLFYTPYPSEADELPFLARSKDGKNFTTTGVTNPLFTRGMKGSWDDHHLADIEVIIVNKRWYMYYSGCHFHGVQKQGRIGLALSHDGKNWTKYGGNPILEPDNSVDWEKGTTMVWMVSTPSVIHYKGRFFMWYSAVGNDGIERICLAESIDGINFTKNSGNPVLTPEAEWEKLGINHPKVVRYNNKLLMLYVGFDGFRYQLGAAKADADIPTEWLKLDSNPLLTGTLNIKLIHISWQVRILKFLAQWEIFNFIYNTYKKINSRWGWESKSIYRASPLVDGKNNLILLNNKMYLYYSAFNILGVPRIGLATINISE
jgi:predicted GH43/DUF377 family glycosyl hydrolase